MVRHRSLSMQRTYPRLPPARHPPFDPRNARVTRRAIHQLGGLEVDDQLHPHASEPFRSIHHPFVRDPR